VIQQPAVQLSDIISAPPTAQVQVCHSDSHRRSAFEPCQLLNVRPYTNPFNIIIVLFIPG